MIGIHALNFLQCIATVLVGNTKKVIWPVTICAHYHQRFSFGAIALIGGHIMRQDGHCDVSNGHDLDWSVLSSSKSGKLVCNKRVCYYTSPF